MAANGIYLEGEFYNSLAFRQLTRKQVGILFTLLERRQFGNQKTVKGKSSRRQILNNGKIVFTYDEAEKLGYSRRTFATAISKLVDVGFIDITHAGNGSIKGDCSLYACSSRWREFGTPDFISKTRKKDTRRARAFVSWNNGRALLNRKCNSSHLKT